MEHVNVQGTINDTWAIKFGPMYIVFSSKVAPCKLWLMLAQLSSLQIGANFHDSFPQAWLIRIE